MSRNVVVSLAVILLSGTIINLASADTIRSGRWEATVQVVGTGSESSDGENGSSIDVDSSTGWGLGLGYNFTEHLALGFDFAYIKPRYEAVFNTEEEGLVSIKHKMSVYNSQFNGTWNIMDGPFTPYLQVGLGWTKVDSNVADGPPSTGCWWDPWWGYICRSFYSTYNETNFSYGYGAGLRYEFRNGLFIKGSVNRVEIDASSDVDNQFDSAKLELGWIFR